MPYHVYILTNADKNVLYVGVTSDLRKRILQHRNHAFAGFTARYNAHKLVHVEEFQDVHEAIAREKQIKSWSRVRKIELVSVNNPAWQDIMPADEIF